MPSLDDLQKIELVTGALEPKIAAAIRVVFLLTEQDSQYMNHYISVAVGLEPKMSDCVREVLHPYNLVDEDGRIPDALKSAIHDAIKSQHLEVRKDNHKIRCDICAGPHQTEKHNDWASQSEDFFSGDFSVEMEKYRDVLEALKSGGLQAAEVSLIKMGLSMSHDLCFCGSSTHSGVAHLRWLADEQGEGFG